MRSLFFDFPKEKDYREVKPKIDGTHYGQDPQLLFNVVEGSEPKHKEYLTAVLERRITRWEREIKQEEIQKARERKEFFQAQEREKMKYPRSPLFTNEDQKKFKLKITNQVNLEDEVRFYFKSALHALFFILFVKEKLSKHPSLSSLEINTKIDQASNHIYVPLSNAHYKSLQTALGKRNVIEEQFEKLDLTNLAEKEINNINSITCGDQMAEKIRDRFNYNWSQNCKKFVTFKIIGEWEKEFQPELWQQKQQRHQAEIERQRQAEMERQRLSELFREQSLQNYFRHTYWNHTTSNSSSSSSIENYFASNRRRFG